MTVIQLQSPIQSINEWQLYRRRRLPEQLRRLIQFVHECQSEPERARPHFHTIRKQLHTAQDELDCRPLLAELVLALHPWPKLWGYWDEWLAVCNQAAVTLGELGQYEAQGWLLADVIEMLFELGRNDEALAVWGQLFAVADERCARPLCRAGHTACTKLILSGWAAEGTAIYEQQREYLAQWQPELPQADYDYAHTLVVLQQTLVMRRQGTQHNALALIDSLLEKLAAWPDAPLDLWRDTWHHQGGVLSSIADYVGSIAAMEKAIAFAVQMSDTYYEAALYSDKAIPLWAAGFYDEVETAVRRSLQLYEKLRANWRLVHSINILLDVFVMRPALEEALAWLPRQIELAQQLNDEATLSDAHTIRGLVYMQQEKYDLALADLQVSTASYQRRGAQRWLVWAQVNLSWCYDALGDEATAVALAHHALQLSREVKAENVELLALRCLARFQTNAEKVVTLQQAVRLAQKINSLFNEAACLFDLVAVAADTAVRQDYWQRAVTLLEQCGVMGWVDGEPEAASGHTPHHPPCLPLIG